MKFSFSFQNIMVRAQSAFSLAAVVRWGLVLTPLLLFAALVLDAFIFYRYSYRVVNLKPEPVVESVKIDRKALRDALEVLDGRAEKFKILYGGGTTTPR